MNIFPKRKTLTGLENKLCSSERKGGGKLRNEDYCYYTYTHTYYIHVSKRPNI